MEKLDVIEELQKLNLSDYPVQEISELIKKMPPIAILLTDYHHTKDIERAVNNTKSEPEFSQVSRLSYKPAKYNTSFQRASTPKTTMFYGAVISELLNEEEKRNARIVGSGEVSTLMRSNEILEGKSRITFGKWRVIEKISLATIIDLTKVYEQPYLNQLKDKYLDFIKNESQEIQNNTIRFLSYYSSEFSKHVNAGQNHEYLISALLTEIMVQKGFDGVIYPSVQTSGYGLCVAIRPEVADQKLRLIKVLESKITKTQGIDDSEFLITNEKNCLIAENATEFKLMDIK